MYGSQLKRPVVDKLLEDKGHNVLRLPPYHCFFNAIEQVWSEAKRYYSKVVASRPGSGTAGAAQVWEEALSQVTPQKWSNYLEQTQKLILEYWKKEVENVPEVNQLIVNLGNSSEEEDEDASET